MNLPLEHNLEHNLNRRPNYLSAPFCTVANALRMLHCC